MLAEDVATAVSQLAAAGVPSPEADAVLLAGHLMGGLSPGEVRAAALRGSPTPDGFADLVAQRAQRVPVQWLTGTTDFCGVSLIVGEGVFIPRPETEALVDYVVRQLPQASTWSGQIVDLCSGSGAVACALADRLPAASVRAVEQDPVAADYAHRNGASYGVDVIVADATGPLPVPAGSVDLVVANPPYIPTEAIPKDPEVAMFDPPMALYGGSRDGLAIPQLVMQQAQSLLKPQGFFAMEHAECQQLALLELFQQAGWDNPQGHQDLAGRPRFVTARRRATNVSMANFQE